MKIAISGKGGVGKTTFASFLIRALADEGKRILAIDADPDANLAQALGVSNSDGITPISEMKALIEERTEAKVGTMGSFFKLNPKVDDLPEKIAIADGIIKFNRNFYLIFFINKYLFKSVFINCFWSNKSLVF